MLSIKLTRMQQRMLLLIFAFLPVLRSPIPCFFLGTALPPTLLSQKLYVCESAEKFNEGQNPHSEDKVCLLKPLFSAKIGHIMHPPMHCTEGPQRNTSNIR